MQELEDLEEAKRDFDEAVKHLSKLARKGFEFKIKVGGDEDSDVLITLADHKPRERLKS